MNAYAPITDTSDGNMTSKGQVHIPKRLRERAGLEPGGEVTIGMNDRGEVVVRPRARTETREERAARVRAAIEEVAGTISFGYGNTDAYMDEIRPWRNDPL